MRDQNESETMTFKITIQKLRIFEKCNESLGGYDHVRSRYLNILSYNEYLLIERLVQDIKLIKKGLAAQSYEEQVNDLIEESCDDEDTIRLFKKIATKL